MTTKKKNSKHNPQPLSSVSGDSAAVPDIIALIRDHAVFFDKLVELVPARFYLPPDDPDEKPWFGDLSKAAKAKAKKETVENTKAARRDRFDPEKSSATGDLLRKAAEGENTADGGEVSGARTLENLRERIRRKREELAAARAPKPENVDKRQKMRELFKGKRKREDGGGGGGVGKPRPIASDVGLTFTHVKLGKDRRKSRRVSKGKVLETAVKLVEAKKKDPAVAERHSWRAAADRAMGVKVHDDPKLVRESMRKEKKRQQKSSEKWKERVEGVEKSRVGAQQARAQHIADRIQDKKSRRIAKREKKLMRPGFEGRREGFINDS